MAKTSGSFKKGHPGYKPKGAVNMTTKQAKEILDQALLKQTSNIESALNSLFQSDPAKYLDACAKLFGYVIPKKTDLTSDNEKLEIKLPDIIIK